MKTPVAFLIFNRPDTTEKVFQVIREAKPAKLLVIADGPRENRVGEAERCEATRAIVERVDWECQVLKNFSSENMGCKQRVSSGLNWVFQTVEEAIILEDDCLPNSSFFPFCEKMLDLYREDERITTIGGVNFLLGQKRTEYSYFFSRYCHIWGWATWRRTWQHYDVEMKLWPTIKDGNWLLDILGDKRQVSYWEKMFQLAYEGKVDTWDYQLTFTCWLQSGLNIMPNVNLISNLGFNADATHTTSTDNWRSNLPGNTMKFPIKNPPFVIADKQADDFVKERTYVHRNLFQRATAKFKKIIK